MGAYHSLERLDDDALDDFPPDVRRAFFEFRRSLAAIRVYERRGWNPSAVLVARERASERLTRLLDDWAFSEENPTLF